MKENKYEGTYFCGICGKAHSTIEERNACESNCIKERHEAEETMKKQMLAEEKQERKDEIDEKYKELKGLVRKYIEDYGSISLSDSSENGLPSLSKLFGSWWF